LSLVVLPNGRAGRGAVAGEKTGGLPDKVGI